MRFEKQQFFLWNGIHSFIVKNERRKEHAKINYFPLQKLIRYFAYSNIVCSKKIVCVFMCMSVSFKTNQMEINLKYFRKIETTFVIHWCESMCAQKLRNHFDQMIRSNRISMAKMVNLCVIIFYVIHTHRHIHRHKNKCGFNRTAKCVRLAIWIVGWQGQM